MNSLLIANEFYYLAILPFVLAIVYLAFYDVEKLMWFIVFTTPISMNLEELSLGGIGMYLPTEPLMFGVMILFFLKLMADKKFDAKIVKHPVTIIILLQLGWILFTSITSEMPIVSLKFLLSRLWFVVCFYFIGTQLFKKLSNYKIFFWCYLIPLAGVVIYAVIRLATYSFNEKAAHWVMEPFFKDHTSYGAILAMFVPIPFIFLAKAEKYSTKVFASIFLTILVIGTIFSYTRAAWVSLVVAVVLFLIYTYKIKFKILVTIGTVGLILLALNWNSLMMDLERNNQDSSANLSEHVKSISNVSTDASNLERINRWTSAWLMFLERPILGWGPGTYVFQYAPFQLSKNKTIISTNVGNNGNAHSEYIGPLAEQGLVGTIMVVLLISMVFYKGSALYHRLPKGELKTVVLFTLLGLFTYVIHGFLNNYLDTDKASVPFWGFIALIVAIDVYHSNDESALLESETK
ncbi:MAG: O-antigen ligase family protein [Flavobacteriales bacterium]|nr:O-antigen ligase family protein [Flavobacteriales bacterium]MCB9363327.1 O-antigen ligase family protein [Flavobacteriales bacterium]